MPPLLSLTGLTEKVSNVCQSEPVSIAYLFGSYARGTADSESDIDLGVLLQRSLLPQDRGKTRFRLMRRIADALGMPLERVDVVILQDVPVLLQYNVIRCGQSLYEHDTGSRSAYELSVEQRYEDELPYLERETDATLERILAHPR